MYVTFLAVVGYCYDRFLLPVCLVLSLFAGHSIARALEWRRERWHATVAVGLVFAYMCLRAASINLLMAADGREAAAPMDSRERRVRALGRHHRAPGIQPAGERPNGQADPDAARDGRVTSRLLDCEQRVSTSIRAGVSRGSVFRGCSRSGKLPYRLVHRVKQPVALAILTWEGPFRETAHVAHTSVNKLNPEILIYRRETTSP